MGICLLQAYPHAAGIYELYGMRAVRPLGLYFGERAVFLAVFLAPVVEGGGLYVFVGQEGFDGLAAPPPGFDQGKHFLAFH